MGKEIADNALNKLVCLKLHELFHAKIQT